ncbi:hypothetical protein FQN60_012081 [Etheostoma spectabile]|uniref:Uncharacterized protein n=1 Tax=Etheostoma spectabile TaxID=54343 RepID=A0A5J5DNS6_9PERO|nr:hypothetical protein FQN60_012081 [Etheostoma spectabile]
MEETDIDVGGQTDGSDDLKNSNLSVINTSNPEFEQSASSFTPEDCGAKARSLMPVFPLLGGHRMSSCLQAPGLYHDLSFRSRSGPHTIPSIPPVGSIIPALSCLLSNSFPSCITFEHLDPGRCTAVPSLAPNCSSMPPVSLHGMNYPASQLSHFPTGILKTSASPLVSSEVLRFSAKKFLREWKKRQKESVSRPGVNPSLLHLVQTTQTLSGATAAHQQRAIEYLFSLQKKCIHEDEERWYPHTCGCGRYILFGKGLFHPFSSRLHPAPLLPTTTSPSALPNQEVCTGYSCPPRPPTRPRPGCTVGEIHSRSDRNNHPGSTLHPETIPQEGYSIKDCKD